MYRLKAGLFYILCCIGSAALFIGTMRLLLVGDLTKEVTNSILACGLMLATIMGPIFWNVMFKPRPAADDILPPRGTVDFLRLIGVFHITAGGLMYLTEFRTPILSIVVGVVALIVDIGVFSTRRSTSLFLREVQVRRDFAAQIVQATKHFQYNTKFEQGVIRPLVDLFEVLVKRGCLFDSARATAEERVRMVIQVCEETDANDTSLLETKRGRLLAEAYLMLMRFELPAREMTGIMVESYVDRLTNTK